jgi:magnesium transporter
VGAYYWRVETTLIDLRDLLTTSDLPGSSELINSIAPQDVASLLDQLPEKQWPIAFRLLHKDAALRVFEMLDSAVQQQLIEDLGDDEVAQVFDSLDPDDQVSLLDELPAKVAKRLVQQLSTARRDIAAVVLGYPKGSIGRRMSPQYVHVLPEDTIERAVERVRGRGRESETIYTLPVIDGSRTLVGVVSLRDLLLAAETDRVEQHMTAPMFAFADDDAEEAARKCVQRRLIATPIVDRETRLVGLLTFDDATRIVEVARDEDEARAGATEPLRRSYLQTPIATITRSRVVWLLVLGVSAILTVNVLELFEATLEAKVALALFIPLLTGIGGNTGSQAATTVTRALAMNEASPRDVGRVAYKEARTGLVLGAILGVIGYGVASLAYDTGIGTVIGLTLLAVCTLSATVGGTMPLVAKSVRVDPAVFSTPFISTFCDATGLIIYFLIAKQVLGI